MFMAGKTQSHEDGISSYSKNLMQFSQDLKGFFMELSKLILKLIWKSKVPRRAKSILKNKVRGHILKLQLIVTWCTGARMNNQIMEQKSSPFIYRNFI